MKRIWRFVKWSVKDFGLFEFSLFSSTFCVGFGAASDDPELRQIAFIIATCIFVLWFVKFAIWDIGRIAWQRFEKAFNILRDKNIK